MHAPGREEPTDESASSPLVSSVAKTKTEAISSALQHTRIRRDGFACRRMRGIVRRHASPTHLMAVGVTTLTGFTSSVPSAAQSHCASSSDRDPRPTGRARTITRVPEGVDCAPDARGARATGGDAFPTTTTSSRPPSAGAARARGRQRAGRDGSHEPSEFLARGGGLVVIHAAAVSRDPDWYRGYRRLVAIRHHEVARGPMHLYFTDRDNLITKDASNWSMEDEIYYDRTSCRTSDVLAAAYTPKPAGRAQRECAEACRRADRRGQAGQRLRLPAADVDVRADDQGGRTPYRSFVSIPGIGTKLSTGEITAPSAAGHCLGPASAAMSMRCLRPMKRETRSDTWRGALLTRRRRRRRSRCTRSSISRSWPRSR